MPGSARASFSPTEATMQIRYEAIVFAALVFIAGPGGCGHDDDASGDSSSSASREGPGAAGGDGGTPCPAGQSQTNTVVLTSKDPQVVAKPLSFVVAVAPAVSS